MAHKKGVGSSRNGRDSNAQRLGLKKFGGEHVLGGNILARQRGTKWKPGKNVGRGKDDTLFSLIEGFVKFENKGQKGKFISVYAEGAAEIAPAETAWEICDFQFAICDCLIRKAREFSKNAHADFLIHGERVFILLKV